ncbi:MAG: tRNA (adenosine(37)-N6)-threonylcarbamoyltransferase complex dimerization subunit type 1 TsaB [Ruminococcus callidus]|nr:tRNA (adenosine(37)-N6)-threonylcarbamoyltransferase complex dimerization subunit type 1 TsaB [Ruminococcus callidus]
MRYLGMDTSGSVAAVALYDTEQDIFLSQQCLYTKKTHSQVILPLVERTLQDCGLTPSDLDGIAVAVGPGSYTGLRIGVAAVKAMAFALHLPCFGISTLESLAYQAATADGLCSAVMKARQNLVYAGLYQNKNGKLQSVVKDGLYDTTEWAGILQHQAVSILMTGDAAMQFTGETMMLAPAAVRLQNATGLCLAARYHEPQTPEQLEANYLQLVKAEKDRQQRVSI